MSSSAQQGARVFITTRSFQPPDNRETHQTVDGLCLGFTMHEDLAGLNGEPAIEAIIVNQDALKHGGSADWQHALIRMGDVVHSTHKDWQEGRVSTCYDLPQAVASIHPTDETDLYLIAARAAHEANRIVCAMQGDFSQLPWDESPYWQRDSAVFGAKQISANPDTTPWQSHESWLEQKKADGWKYGPEKNAVTKEHPAFMPYDGLPDSQKIKDFFFGTVVRAVLDYAQIPLGQLPVFVPFDEYQSVKTQLARATSRTEMRSDVSPGVSLLERLNAEHAQKSAATPPQVTQQHIDEQNEHDRATGNVNDKGETPYESVDGERQEAHGTAEEPASQGEPVEHASLPSEPAGESSEPETSPAAEGSAPADAAQAGEGVETGSGAPPTQTTHQRRQAREAAKAAEKGTEPAEPPVS